MGVRIRYYVSRYMLDFVNFSKMYVGAHFVYATFKKNMMKNKWTPASVHPLLDVRVHFFKDVHTKISFIAHGLSI